LTSLGINVNPYLKNNQSKEDWRCGSSNRVPEFKPQYFQKNKKIFLKAEE
jgi:hypothetical protein